MFEKDQFDGTWSSPPARIGELSILTVFGSLATVLVKIGIAWDVTLCPLEVVTGVLKALFQEVLRLLDPIYVGRKLFRNVRKYLPIDKRISYIFESSAKPKNLRSNVNFRPTWKIILKKGFSEVGSEAVDWGRFTRDRVYRLLCTG